MRMWMLNPVFLCRVHLLGAHGEIHKFRHNFVKGHAMPGRYSPIVQISPYRMKEEHDRLAAEMPRRGYMHKSPYELPDLSYLPDEFRYAEVDLEYNMIDLSERCPECRNRILEYDHIVL